MKYLLSLGIKKYDLMEECIDMYAYIQYPITL